MSHTPDRAVRSPALRAVRIAAPLLLTALAVLFTPGIATAAPSPSQPSTVTSVGTSFLTAAAVPIDATAAVHASTGDYLYWSFAAEAGATARVAATVTLPPKADRHGPATWSLDVFDGLRRRQSCTVGAQVAAADPAVTEVRLDCTLREVRAWADPWSADPLPGTYYARVAAITLPDADQGLPISVNLRVTAENSSDPTPEGGDLKAPLAPPTTPGSVRGAPAADQDGSTKSDDSDLLSTDWWPGVTSRWIWTSAGGVLAAIAGVGGYRMTRRRRI